MESNHAIQKGADMYCIKKEKPFYVKYWNRKIDVNMGINPRK